MRLWGFFVALVFTTLACGSQTPRRLELYPSETPNPTQTPFVLEVTKEVVRQVTNTPEPTESTVLLCVDASESVYLRPSPSTNNYPITSLPNGEQVVDLGGRDGDWMFVRWQDKAGWVNDKYVKVC